MTPAGPPADGRPVVVYDGDCAFCTAWARLGARLDRRGRLRWASSTDPARLRALGVTPRPESATTLVVHDPRGGMLTESRAVAAVVAAIPLAGPPLAALIRAGRPALDPLYRWVSRNRGPISRALGFTRRSRPPGP